MARVDKTESAIGVVRGTVAAAWSTNDYNKVIGVGINASGLTVKGAGTSGIVGVVIPNRLFRDAGDRCDIFVLADIALDAAELVTPGAKLYVDNTTGALTTTATGGTQVGFSVEADRLIIRL